MPPPLYSTRVALVLAAAAVSAHAAFPSCGNRTTTPGIDGVCSYDAAACAWCQRDHLSFDFLCCEPGKWIGPHFTNPLFIYMMINDVAMTLFVVFAFELFELMIFMTTGIFDAAFNPDDAETLAASLVGDVLIQAGLALVVGFCLRTIFVVPTLISSAERVHAYRRHGRRCGYVSVLLLGLLLSSLIFIELADKTRLGLMLHTVIMVPLIIWLIVPVAMARDRVDEQMIWQQMDGSTFSGLRKATFFAAWGGVVLASELPHWFRRQPIIATNEWFLQWLFIGPLAALFALIALVVSCMRADYRSVSYLVAIAALVAGAGCLSANGILFAYQTGSSALVVLAGVLFLLAIIGFLVGTLVACPRPRGIPGAPRGVNLSAAEVAVIGSTLVFTKEEVE